MKFLMSLFFLLLIHSSVFAQNSSLLDRTAPELSVDFNSLCNETIKAAGDMNIFFKEVLQNFRYSPVYASYNDNKAVFNTTHFDVPLVDALAKNFFKDPKQVKAVYKAAFPIFLAQFKAMTPNEQKLQLKFIQEAIDYTSSFDLAKESADLERLSKAGTRFDSEKGRIKAFVYRRLANNEMSQKDALYWLKKIQKGIKPHLSTAQTPEDEYVLTNINYADNHFVLGQIIGADSYAIFEKNGDNYKMMPLEDGFSCTNKAKGERNWGWVLLKGKDKSLKIGLLRKGQPFLTFEAPITADKNQDFFSVKQFNGSKAWGFGPGHYSNGITVIHALNTEGKLEQMDIASNDQKSEIFLFTFKSGATELLYDSNYKDRFSSLQKIKKLYPGRERNELWLVDEKYQLFYYHHIRKQEPVLVTSGSPIKALKITNASNLVIQYEGGKSDFVLLDYNKNITRVTLPENLDVRDIRQAWRNKDKTLFYYITLENELEGLMEESGKTILKPEYESITLDGENLLVKKDGKFGLIDKEGKVLLKTIYPQLRILNLDPSGKDFYAFFNTEKNNLVGLLDKNEKVLLKPEFTYLDYFTTDNSNVPLFKFRKATSDKEGVMDINGKVLLPEKYTHIEKVGYNEFYREEWVPLPLYIVAQEDKKKDTKYALFSESFKQLTDYMIDYQEGMDTIITFDAETFQEIVQVIINNNSGSAKKHYDGLYFSLFSNKKEFVFDRKGKIIIPAVWDQVLSAHSPNYFKVRKGEKWGLINLSNKVIIPTEYENIETAEVPFNGYYTLKINTDNYNLADSTGKMLFAEPQAEIATYKDIPLLFVGKKMADKMMKYALYSKAGKALTDFLFSPDTDTTFVFDPDTFEEIVKIVARAPGGNHDLEKKTITLLRDGKEVIYNFEGKEVK